MSDSGTVFTTKESFADATSLKEVRSAVMAMTAASLKTRPLDSSMLVIFSFLFLREFDISRDGSGTSPKCLAAFIDALITTNRLRLERGDAPLDHRELELEALAFANRTTSEQFRIPKFVQPPRAHQPARPQPAARKRRRSDSEPCAKWNRGECSQTNRHTHVKRDGSKINLAHVCNAVLKGGAKCLRPHPQTQHQ